MIMSEEDGRLNQHLVPQAHLLRFTDAEGKLNVHRFTDDGRVKAYRTGTKNVSAEINYYDDGNPYDEKSIETFLRNQEKRGQPSVDKVLESRSDIHENRRVVKYVLMLLGRTLPFATKRYVGDDPLPYHLTDDDERHFRQTSIFDAMDNPLLQDPEDMLCCHIRKDGGMPFVTADVPLAIMSLDLEKDQRITKDIGTLPPMPPNPNDPLACEKAERQIGLLREAFRNSIVICPLSPDVCAIVYHRTVTDIIDRLKRIMSPDPILTINSMMILGAVENVYSNIPLKEYIEGIRSGTNKGPVGPTDQGCNHTSDATATPIPALQSGILLEIRFNRLGSGMNESLGEVLKGFHLTDEIPMTEPNGQPVTVYRFESNDGIEHVFASVRHLTVAADTFTGWEEFSREAKLIAEEFMRKFGIGSLERIGLRAHFLMKPSVLLNRGPLAMFTPMYAELFRAPSSISHIGRVIREFETKASIMNRVVASTPTLMDGEVGADVDVDSFIEMTVTADGWWHSVEMLWESNRETLKGAIPKELHKKLGL